MRHQIWIEGWGKGAAACTAQFIGTMEGDATFADAVKRYALDFRGWPSNLFDETTCSFNGVRFHPTEEEARRRNG
jgi:hypothetical protein